MRLIVIFFLTSALVCQEQKLNQAEFLKELDKLAIEQVAGVRIPSIAVGIVKDGKVVLAKAYGYADVEKKILADEHTIYQLGSTTKFFAGHLLAKLISKNKIKLSDPLSDFFPTIDFESDDSKQITIKHMATHSSGFPRYPNNLDRIDPHPVTHYSLKSMQEAIAELATESLDLDEYVYSNFGYGVLGIAMQNRMQSKLCSLMDEYILKPYEMNSSSLERNDEINTKLAQPYLEMNPLIKTDAWKMESMAAAANMFSSVKDMTKFMLEVLKENPANRIQQSAYLKINETWDYGLGCFIVDSKKRKTKIVFHGGDIDGYASSFNLYPEYQLGVTILCNWGEGELIGDSFNKISTKIVDYYLGKSID